MRVIKAPSGRTARPDRRTGRTQSSPSVQRLPSGRNSGDCEIVEPARRLHTGGPFMPLSVSRAGPLAPKRRYRSLDHWRGIACLLVVVYHSTIVYLASSTDRTSWANAAAEFTHRFNVGVALFFVISGYCISAAADNARRTHATVGEYFVRRIRRIYPPYWIVVMLSIGLFFLIDYRWTHPLLSTEPWMQYRPWWYSPSQWIGNLTLTETWRHYVFGGMRGHFPGQAWTLCYEEQFYFVTGMALLLARQRFFLVMALISVATLGVQAIATASSVVVNGFFFDGSWLLFAAGVAVFYRIHHAGPRMAVGLDLLLVSMIPTTLALPVPIYGASIGFAFAAALPWLYRYDEWLSSQPAFTPLLRCGQMCYSLYLVHQIPVKAVTLALYRSGVTTATATLFVTTPAAVLASVALGWAFHVNVERRFLNSHPRQGSAGRERSAILETQPRIGTAALGT